MRVWISDNNKWGIKEVEKDKAMSTVVLINETTLRQSNLLVEHTRVGDILLDGGVATENEDRILTNQTIPKYVRDVIIKLTTSSSKKEIIENAVQELLDTEFNFQDTSVGQYKVDKITPELVEWVEEVFVGFTVRSWSNQSLTFECEDVFVRINLDRDRGWFIESVTGAVDKVPSIEGGYPL